MRLLTKFFFPALFALAMLPSCDKDVNQEPAPEPEPEPSVSELSFEVNFGEINAELLQDTLSVTVIPSSDNENERYFFRMLEKTDYVSPEVHVDSDFYAFNKEARRRGTDLEDVLKDSLYTGTSTVEKIVLRDVKDYILYAYQVMPDNTVGECFTFDYSFPDADPSVFRLNLDVQDIKSVSFRLIAEPSDVKRYYYIDVFDAKAVNSYPDIEAFVDAYVDQFRAFMPYVVKKGPLDFEYTASNIYPDTEYVFFGFAIDTQTMEPTSEIFHKEFKTEKAQTDDFTCTFDIGLSQLVAKVTRSVSDEGVKIYHNTILLSEYNEKGEAAFREPFDKRFQELKEQNPGVSDEKIVSSMLERGSVEKEFTTLKPSEDYVTYVVVCDDKGNFVSDYFTESFRTLDFVYSKYENCYIRLKDPKYFWGDDLNEVSPSPYYADRVVSVFEKEEMGADAKFWMSVSLRGDYRDPETISDWEIIEMYNSQTVKGTPKDKFNNVPLIWYVSLNGEDTLDMTYAIICIDKDGYYAPVQRFYIRHDRQGASPVDEWFEKYASQGLKSEACNFNNNR